MRTRTTRVERVESEIRQILSLFLQHKLGDPLPCYASITAVEAHPDLRHAKVYFRLIGDQTGLEAGREILEARRGRFQQEVARHLQTKFCPVLRFEYGVADGDGEIDRMLARLHRPLDAAALEFGD